MEALRLAWIDSFERTLAALSRCADRWGRSSRSSRHLTVGLEGERAAYFYLRRKGYTIVAERWSSGEVPGDVDLIAWLGPMLCFVEVKTRTAHDLAPAEAAVDSQKRRTLRRLAGRYLQRLPQPHPQVRFDVISVYLVPGEQVEIVQFENAFHWKE